MVKKFHPPVHKILVLRSLNTVFPEDIKRKLMAIIFPKLDEELVFERLKRCAAKKMAYTKDSIISCCKWGLIPFLLNQKAYSLVLHDMLNAERRYLHEWCECLALQHESFDKPEFEHQNESLQYYPFDYDADITTRVLVIKKPPNWSLHDILPPKQKTPEERQREKRVSN